MIDHKDFLSNQEFYCFEKDKLLVITKSDEKQLFDASFFENYTLFIYD